MRHEIPSATLESTGVDLELVLTADGEIRVKTETPPSEKEAKDTALLISRLRTLCPPRRPILDPDDAKLRAIVMDNLPPTGSLESRRGRAETILIRINDYLKSQPK